MSEGQARTDKPEGAVTVLWRGLVHVVALKRRRVLLRASLERLQQMNPNMQCHTCVRVCVCVRGSVRKILCHVGAGVVVVVVVVVVAVSKALHTQHTHSALPLALLQAQTFGMGTANLTAW